MIVDGTVADSVAVDLVAVAADWVAVDVAVDLVDVAGDFVAVAHFDLDCIDYSFHISMIIRF